MYVPVGIAHGQGQVGGTSEMVAMVLPQIPHRKCSRALLMTIYDISLLLFFHRLRIWR